MDLENLKSEWSAMNARMEKQEIIKEKMFYQMLNTKSDKSLGRLVTYDLVSLIASILFIPVLFYLLNKNGMELIRTVAIGAIIFLVICVIWYGIKLFVLSKIDFTKTVKNNLLYVNKYAVYVKYGKLIEYYFIIPLVVLASVIGYAKLHAPLFLWVLMSCIMIVAILVSIYFYRQYSKNISTIKQNLEELRELKEE
jgi:hypothetical protein